MQVWFKNRRAKWRKQQREEQERQKRLRDQVRIDGTRRLPGDDGSRQLTPENDSDGGSSQDGRGSPEDSDGDNIVVI